MTARLAAQLYSALFTSQANRWGFVYFHIPYELVPGMHLAHGFWDNIKFQGWYWTQTHLDRNIYLFINTDKISRYTCTDLKSPAKHIHTRRNIYVCKNCSQFTFHTWKLCRPHSDHKFLKSLLPLFFFLKISICEFYPLFLIFTSAQP